MIGAPYAGNCYTSYGYGWLIAALYGLCPGFPWHAALMLTAEALALWLVLDAMVQRRPLAGALCFLGLFLGVALKFVVRLQYTAVPAFAFAAALAVLFAADGALYRAREPGWDEQVAYDKARTELMDYRSAPETWALAQDELGWSGEYVSMASNWYFLDDRFTTETAQTLSELADAQSSFPSLALIVRRTGSMLWQYAVFRWHLIALAHADTLFVTDTAQSFLAEDARAVAPNLLEWGNAMLRSPMYRRKLEALGRAGFGSANLADEGVRLLISDSAALESLLAYLNADFFPCEAVREEAGAGFTVWRIRRTGKSA